TRIAILRHKAEEDGVELPDEVIEFVAGNFRSNIRELEGSLIRLLANATLRQQDITLDLAREVLKDLIRRPQVELTIGEIQRVVSEYLNVPEDLIRARTRKREVAQARQISMYFCKKLTKHSLKTIGLHFGGRDHSTVIHAIQTVENMNETDKDFAERLTALSQKLAYAG
ncbi:MAG: helix-turn-helix domain-containing protein, partial [Bacteroidota bacterium]